MSGARSAGALVAILATTTAARTALASPSARLVYARDAGTETCPAEADLRKAVATRIGYDPFFPAATKTVIAQISRAPKGYRGRVQIVGDDGNVRGSRDLASQGDDCSELLSALALAISIALDDLDDGKPPPAGSAATDAPPATPPPAIDPAPPPTPTERDAARDAPAPPVRADPNALRLYASLGPTASLAIAPSPAVGGSIAVTLRYGLFAGRLALRADLPATGDLAGGGTVKTNVFVTTASACLRGDVPFVCLGLGIGSFAASTAGVFRPSDDTAVLVTGSASAGADVPLSARLYLEPFVEAGIVATRHRVTVDGVESYRLPIFAGAAGIHLGWRFL